jgi:small subunit ribosomal protein S7
MQKQYCFYGYYHLDLLNMPRRPLSTKRILLPDPMYNSVSVALLVNRVLKNGKKALAHRIVYNALKEVGTAVSLNPVEVFDQALENVTPKVEVKPRRKAGAIQMVPSVNPAAERAKATALMWILQGCSKRKGQNTVGKLKTEILDAFKKQGFAVRKREELYKLAVANAMYAKKPQIILNAVIETV